jgi:hypothetical protein
MTRDLVRAVGGLWIVAGVLAAATPARATVWKNYANEAKCMGVSGGVMTPGTKLIMWDCNGNPDQDWGESFTGYMTYDQIYDEKTPAPNAPEAECIALPASQTAPGTYFIIWYCSAFTDDQKWAPFPVLTDSNGHTCYSFQNLQAIDRKQGTMVPTPYLNEVTNGSLIVLEQWHNGSWFDQMWCAY